ncbi:MULTISPECIES: hypothetical protein [Sorangium]|uniref:Uncharacterized protein n=1 Tax=Sorangium cellulosum TaxID=56 RepID=A0A4P2QYB7_SORCE|nr:MULTISPECIES: hypothetical protein [Sorangium]AUX35236.1 uncharacterized protein SOCE836_074260 [Sorangium cellulosum]WCQ94541.1 hypothetical protein NQZ70_07309 [Sorangium sp. Soce836]
MKALPRLQPIELLQRKASLAALGALPLCNYQSLPVPVPGPGGLRVAFVYGRSTPQLDGGLLIQAPRYIALVDAEAGAVKEVRLLPGGTADELPSQAVAAPSGAAESRARRAHLLAGYDVLMPEFAAGRTHLPPGAARVAAEFEPLFRQMAEQPLLPVYAELGQSFFRWLAAAAT